MYKKKKSFPTTDIDLALPPAYTAVTFNINFLVQSLLTKEIFIYTSSNTLEKSIKKKKRYCRTREIMYLVFLFTYFEKCFNFVLTLYVRSDIRYFLRLDNTRNRTSQS